MPMTKRQLAELDVYRAHRLRMAFIERFVLGVEVVIFGVLVMNGGVV